MNLAVDKRIEQMMNAKTKSQGFTLVEIMIVVALIGLLATMAIPAFVKVRMTSHAKVCINNLRQVDDVTQQWALETKQDPNATVTFAAIQPYLKNCVICPAGGTSFADSYSLTTVTNHPTCQILPITHFLPPLPAN
jgi:prepilin-type N-terminal cleavage/methylation domain-containing protein